VEAAHPGLVLTVALAAGVLGQTLARHTRLPGIVILLALGVLLGPELLGWVRPRALGAGLIAAVDLAVAVILFAGALNLEISRLRREHTAIRRLVLWGALITLGGASVAARVLLDWPWALSALFGSLVVVTGPTVVIPLLRELRLKPRLATVLEAEGVLIDPVGAILAVLVLEIALSPGTDTFGKGALGFMLRMGFGAAAGAAAGLLLVGLLRTRRIVPEGLENVFTLASVLALYQGCDALVSTSGILAVVVAGVVVGNSRIHVDRDLREFKDQLTMLLIGLLFILLGADVGLEDVRRLGWPGLAVLATLVLVVRPLNVWLVTAGSELSGRERLFVSWMAPRGIVAAAVASVTASAIESQGLTGGGELRALVFLTIAGTVLIAGLTAGPVAAMLDLRLPAREAVAILGAQGLGLALGAELRAASVPVVFLDSNPQSSRRAQRAGFDVVLGNALDERTLQRAGFERVGTAIGLTPNEILNSLFVAEARESFGVRERYVALAGVESEIPPELLRRREAQALFEGPHDVSRWDVRSRHGELGVEHLVFRGAEAAAEGAEREGAGARSRELYVILSIRRGARVLPMSGGLKPREGDIAAVALSEPDREAALEALGKLGWVEE
jgi:NhaP-type Na+/H+ or K+/H+ antiporter